MWPLNQIFTTSKWLWMTFKAIFRHYLYATWPQIDFWLTFVWRQECITHRTRILVTKFGSHMKFLCKLTPGWPLGDLLPHEYITLCAKTPLTKFSSQRAFLCKLLHTTNTETRRIQNLAYACDDYSIPLWPLKLKLTCVLWVWTRRTPSQ